SASTVNLIAQSQTGAKVSIANSNPNATLDVQANTGTLAVASISGKTSFASLVVDNSGVGDLFTASSSGLSRFVIAQNGNVGIGTTAPAQLLDIASSGSPVLNIDTTATSGTNTSEIDFTSNNGAVQNKSAIVNSTGGFLNFLTNGFSGNT